METLNVSSPKQSINDIKVGEGVKIYDFVNLYGCEIGDQTKIGTFVEIQRGAVIGKNCKISSHSFICEGVTIEDGVFIGHGVMFVNDKYPRSINPDGTMQTQADWELQHTVVKKGASIGTNSTILGNVTIGENAIIGAGSLVSKDVPDNCIAYGNPARIKKQISK